MQIDLAAVPAGMTEVILGTPVRHAGEKLCNPCQCAFYVQPIWRGDGLALEMTLDGVMDARPFLGGGFGLCAAVSVDPGQQGITILAINARQCERRHDGL